MKFVFTPLWASLVEETKITLKCLRLYLFPLEFAA